MNKSFVFLVCLAATYPNNSKNNCQSCGRNTNFLPHERKRKFFHLATAPHPPGNDWLMRACLSYYFTRSSKRPHTLQWTANFRAARIHSRPPDADAMISSTPLITAAAATVGNFSSGSSTAILLDLHHTPTANYLYTPTSTIEVVNATIINNNNSTTTNFNDSISLYHPVFPAYIRTTSMVLCIVIMCLGVVGNVMVPIVIFKTKDMRNSTNIFLVNLSVADLMVLLVCTPTVLVEVNSRPETWVLGEELCKWILFFFNLLLYLLRVHYCTL